MSLAPFLLDVQINASLAGAGAALSGSVREPLTAAFRTSFGEQLIPAFQNATQKMFAQMSQTLDKGEHTASPLYCAIVAGTVAHLCLVVLCLCQG